MKGHTIDLMRPGELWEYRTNYSVEVHYIVRRMDTSPAECHWAINLEEAKISMLWDVRGHRKYWKRIA